MATKFPTKQIINGLPPITSTFSEIDLKTNRNAKMIQTLLDKNVNGVFLYFLHKDSISADQGFMLPPGLTEEQIEEFKFEFLNLFERYAKLVNKGGT